MYTLLCGRLKPFCRIVFFFFRRFTRQSLELFIGSARVNLWLMHFFRNKYELGLKVRDFWIRFWKNYLSQFCNFLVYLHVFRYLRKNKIRNWKKNFKTNVKYLKILEIFDELAKITSSKFLNKLNIFTTNAKFITQESKILAENQIWWRKQRIFEASVNSW